MKTKLQLKRIRKDIIRNTFNDINFKNGTRINLRYKSTSYVFLSMWYNRGREIEVATEHKWTCQDINYFKYILLNNASKKYDIEIIKP